MDLGAGAGKAKASASAADSGARRKGERERRREGRWSDLWGRLVIFGRRCLPRLASPCECLPALAACACLGEVVVPWCLWWWCVCVCVCAWRR